jgi:filamentous hemagglutinin family protein
VNKAWVLSITAIVSNFGMSAVLAQSIIVDGSTRTNFNVRSDGSISITPDAKNSNGVSHNKFTKFDVPKPGVTFDNRTVRAGTIVNEVTGTRRSSIEGAVAVDGPAANVIVANPNGITVNGGSFINTGSVALTTGAPLILGSDVKITVQQGSIDIVGAGLSGDFRSLDLIAKQVRATGKIEATNPDGSVRVLAGTSAATLDTTNPGGGINGWLRRDFTVSGTSPELAVDISSQILAPGGAIKIIVNDRGAGVNIGGDVRAGSSGFSLQNDGHVAIRDAAVRSMGAIDIRSKSLSVVSDKKIASLVSDDSGVTISAKEKTELRGAVLTGKTRAVTSFEPLGAVSIAGGDITFTKADIGNTILTSTGDDVAVIATGRILDQGTAYRSVKDVLWSAQDGASLRSASVIAGQDIRAVIAGPLSFADSSVVAQRNVRLKAEAISVLSEGRRSAVTAVDNAVIMEAGEGGFLNSGSEIMGLSRAPGEEASRGAVTIITAGALVNRSLSSDRIASIVGERDDIAIKADHKVLNETGRIVAGGKISIESQGVVENVTQLTTGRFDGPITHRSSTGIFKNYGQPLIKGEVGQILSADQLTIKASNISNRGAQISGSAIDFKAGTILNETLVVGTAFLKRRCLLFCKTSGGADVSQLIARVDAGGAVTMEAKSRVVFTGSYALAGTDISIASPLVEIQHINLPIFARRPVGLYNAFSGHGGWLSSSWSGSFVLAVDGNISIDSNQSVLVSGSQLRVGKEKRIARGETVIEKPYDVNPIGARPVGILNGLR